VIELPNIKAGSIVGERGTVMAKVLTGRREVTSIAIAVSSNDTRDSSRTESV